MATIILLLGIYKKYRARKATALLWKQLDYVVFTKK